MESLGITAPRGKSLIEDIKRTELTRYPNLPAPLKVWFVSLTIVGLLLAVVCVFGYSYRGQVLLPAQYHYLLIAPFSSNVFLILPGRKKDNSVRWYDLTACFLTFCVGIYLFLNAWEITNVGWTPPTSLQLSVAIVTSLLLLEGGRRMAGNIYFAVCLFFALYPVFASHMPGMLFGSSLSFPDTLSAHIFGSEGILGLPASIMGDILVGFLLFAAILIASGAGDFFVRFALATCGRFRGGPAKVSVVSSALFGTISGSAVSNVVADGSITIPTMIRVGFPPPRAAAIEACASTGGVLMPPVMGAVAFVMAAFLNITYKEVCIAAAIPAILYYFGLAMQIDCYAAAKGLKGIPRNELPSLIQTLKNGWPYLIVLLFLGWGLLYMDWEMYTPFYACALMFVLSYFSRQTMMTFKKCLGGIATAGQLIVATIAVMMPIGFIIAGLNVTGSSASFASGIVALGGGSVFLMLLLGAAASFIMGMAGLMISAYIFLAISLAPAVIQAGHLNTVAVHLFILYWVMLSAITPPVAVAVFVAAAIGGTEPMRTGLHAMRLALIIYFIPFFFVYNPALILQAPWYESAVLFALALLGIVFIASGLENYLYFNGKIDNWLARLALIIGGLLIVFPEFYTTVAGFIIIIVVSGLLRLSKRKLVGRIAEVEKEPEI